MSKGRNKISCRSNENILSAVLTCVFFLHPANYSTFAAVHCDNSSRYVANVVHKLPRLVLPSAHQVRRKVMFLQVSVNRGGVGFPSPCSHVSSGREGIPKSLVPGPFLGEDRRYLSLWSQVPSGGWGYFKSGQGVTSHRTSLLR